MTTRRRSLAADLRCRAANVDEDGRLQRKRGTGMSVRAETRGGEWRTSLQSATALMRHPVHAAHTPPARASTRTGRRTRRAVPSQFTPLRALGAMDVEEF